MQIVGECRDAAAARKLIADEGDPVKSGHKCLQATGLAPYQQKEARRVPEFKNSTQTERRNRCPAESRPCAPP